MTSGWQPYREPLGSAILRTGTIAVVIGAVLAHFWGGWRHWPVATFAALWPSFGGHWLEVWFLNWLRPRLPAGRGVHTAGRIAVWFVGGTALGAGMGFTAMLLGGWHPARLPAWWVAGVAFIGIELAAHMALALGGRPSFYDGQG
jgi:hypothetical protein